MSASLFETMKAMSRAEQEALIARTPEVMALQMAHGAWWFMARPEQLAPATPWSVWLLLAGRGFGKTRTASEWLADEVIAQPHTFDGTPTEWAIIGETFGDSRNICVEGPSGFLIALKKRGLTLGVDFFYNKSSWQINFLTGQRVHMLGADDADAGRGLNLAGLWADEIAKWRYPFETWFEGLAPALRIGLNPRAVVSTTPKPNKLLIDWQKRFAAGDPSVYITRGSTFDNAANLSPAALTELRARYDGTKLGRQELYGELLDDIEGALWTLGQIEADRMETAPPLRRVIVAIDPSGGHTKTSDEQGIVVCAEGANGHYYVLEDATVTETPAGWARAAIGAYQRWEADRIVAEKNFGGDMVESTIRQVDPNVPVKMVNASRGKAQRAEPIAALYEQHRVHHIGVHRELEEQMTTWTPDSGISPDRMDALVWALTELAFGQGAAAWTQWAKDQTDARKPPPVKLTAAMIMDEREAARQASFRELQR
jgi:phage terminase large subunit-like protein